MPPRAPRSTPTTLPGLKPAVRSKGYWTATRAPRYSLLFALPLLLLYETLAFGLTHDTYAGVRNGADVLLKSVFVWLGGPRGLLVFGVLLVGIGLVLVIRDWRRNGGVKPNWFLLNGGFCRPNLLSSHFAASSAELRRNSKTVPWNSLVPERVTAVRTPPDDRPYSAL